MERGFIERLSEKKISSGGARGSLLRQWDCPPVVPQFQKVGQSSRQRGPVVCRGGNQEGHIDRDYRNCFTCGQSGHRKSACPMGAGQVGQVTPNQTYRLLPPSAQSV